MKITGAKLAVKKLRGLDNKINQAASNGINRTATKARTEAIDAITDKYTLSASYVNGKLKVVARSSPLNLRATIASNTVATLLDRFQSVDSKDGVKVRVRRSSGMKTINGSFRVKNLTYSGTTGIAMSKVDARRYYKSQGLNGLANKIKGDRGIHVLHSMSINQIFETIKDDIAPNVQAFLLRTFLRNLDK